MPRSARSRVRGGRQASDLSKKTILLLSTGRSGSTWLAGLLAQPFRYRLLFEPFQPLYVPQADLVADRYVSLERLSPDVARFYQQALSDQIDNPWIAQNTSRMLGIHRWRFWPRVNICKSVRSNLFVPACRALLGPDFPIVVLMRHPGAVVESFRRVQFPWARDVARLLDQQAFQETFGVPLDRLRAYTDSDIGCYAVRWVVENGYLLERGAEFGIHLVHYEDLMADPVAGIEALCRRVGIEPIKDLQERVVLPSNTTHDQSPLKARQDTVAAWQDRLSPDDRALLQEVLDVAGVRYPR